MDYELENVVNQRKEVEKAIIKKLVNKNSKYKIYSLFKNERTNEIQSYSCYEADNKTSLFIHRNERYNYNHLSKQIHTFYDERAKIEEEISKLIKLDKNVLVHILFKEFKQFQFKENKHLLIEYCNRVHCKLPSREDLNKILKLIRKWQIASENYHYRISKQDKRKLKKIHSRTRMLNINFI